MTKRQRFQGCSLKSRNANSHQKLQEARTRISPRVLGGSMALLTPKLWPSNMYFSFLASRAVVLSHQVCGNTIIQQPQETNTNRVVD